MKKRILGMTLAFAMMIGYAPVATRAETGTKYGDYLYYEVNSDNTAVTITDCDESASEITIPNEIEGLPVTSIGDYAFGYESLTSVTVPENVSKIGKRAFGYRTSVNVSENNQYYRSVNGVLFNKDVSVLIHCSMNIADYSYTIPNTVTTIGEYAFGRCYSLVHLTIPNSVTSIEGSAFYDCQNLTDFVIPNSVSDIGLYAFYNCRTLTKIVLPDGLETISDSMFDKCSNVEFVIIPTSVTFISSRAFYDMSRLKDIYYAGTEEQWNDIKIGYQNYDLNKATIHYNYTCTTPDTYEIGEITPTETGVTLTVQPKETVSGKQMVVVACYDGNGSFTGAKTRQITASEEVQNISIDIDKSKASAVKAFIWNDIGYMMPASRVQSLEL